MVCEDSTEVDVIVEGFDESGKEIPKSHELVKKATKIMVETLR